MKRGSFQIATRDGSYTVDGYIVDANFGVDLREYAYRGRLCRLWVVTHLPTGYKVPHAARTRKDAVAAIQIFNSWPTDWSKGRFGQKITLKSSFFRSIFLQSRNDSRWRAYLSVELQ